MSNEAIRQHQQLARGESLGGETIESPFKSGTNHGGTRGELSESKRALKSGIVYDSNKMATQSAPDHGDHK